jgi:hypothetical protein
MSVDAGELAGVLRLPLGAEIDLEPLGVREGSPVRATVRGAAGEAPRVVLARPFVDTEQAFNHVAVLDALARCGYAQAPRLLGASATISAEQWIDGVSALALVPPPGSGEAAMGVLAALHGLSLQEGLDWDRTPEETLPSSDIPLHRLGFAGPEREPARGPLIAAHQALLAIPFGFAHRNATAASVLLAPGRAWLVGFGHAGFGPQLFDVAAFLLTSGLEAPARNALAASYAKTRGLTRETAGLVDLAGVIWGLNELLAVPRRQVECFGDDAATEALRTAAMRIERGVRSAAGEHPAAMAIRSALWPAYHPADG